MPEYLCDPILWLHCYFQFLRLLLMVTCLPLCKAVQTQCAQGVHPSLFFHRIRKGKLKRCKEKGEKKGHVQVIYFQRWFSDP